MLTQEEKDFQIILVKPTKYTAQAIISTFDRVKEGKLFLRFGKDITVLIKLSNSPPDQQENGNNVTQINSVENIDKLHTEGNDNDI